MKKKVVIIVVILVAVVAAIIIGSLYFKGPRGEDTSGTIGKAEKFRKGQFTEEDILLRDDILKDTAAVGKTLDQILSFASFMQQEKLIIDSMWLTELKKACPTYPDCDECSYCKEAITQLQDYSTFLLNKKETVNTTINILMAAYNGKSRDLTFDVGVSLVNFVQFIDEMVARDSVLTNAIKLVDQYLSKEKVTDKKRQAEINRLKKVRDHMVIDNLLFAMKTGDKKQSDMVANMPLSSSGSVLQIVLYSSDQNLGTAANQNIGSAPDLQVFMNVTGLDAVANSPNIGVYSAGRLDAAVYNNSFVTVNNVSDVFRNTEAFNNVFNFSAVSLSSSGSNLNMADVIGNVYSNVYTAANLPMVSSVEGTIFSADVVINVLTY